MAGDKDTVVRRGVARNPSAPVEAVLAVVVAARDEVLVAGALGTGVEELDRLLGSRYERVRVALARRPYLPGLAVLAGDQSVKVRAAVAGQRATPDEILRVLAADPSETVRSRVHANRSASAETQALAALGGVGSAGRKK